MADTVHYHLERMLPELDDLEKRGLFTRSEIKEIVKKRRDFEYLLKRHSTLKQDYYRYIEYEQKLEALRRIRKNGLVRDLKGTGEKWKHSLCDRASCMRIMLIYERAVTKFKGDLSLWLQYLEYCRSQASTKMQKVTTRCLQLHPNVPGLWMYAAAWEFEHNLNVKAARALMQRGLRMCPHAENLWLEYFRLELTYMQKLKARRLVLGLEPTKSSAGKNASKDSSAQMQSDVARNDEGEAVEAVGNGDKNHDVSLEDKLSYKLAQVVYRNATEAIPSSLGFRQRFLEALDTFEFDNKEDLEKQIQASITYDFPADESSWDWLARRHVQSDQRAVQVFEDALTALPSTRMYELYANFLTGLLDAETVGRNSGPGMHNIVKKSYRHDVADALLQLYKRGLASEIFSEDLAKGHLELLLRSGRLDEVSELDRKFFGLVQLKKSASLWELRIALAMNSRSSIADQDTETVDRRGTVLNLFQESLKSVSLAESKRLWLLVFEYYTGQDSYVQIILEMLQKALSGSSGGQVGADLACTAVNWILHSQGIKQARQVYHRFLALPGPSVEFFKLCITIEARHVGAGSMESFQNVRKLFNEAVEIFGKNDTDLWIEYYREELKAGNIDAANNVYWRAKKSLQDPTSFIERHQTL